MKSNLRNFLLTRLDWFVVLYSFQVIVQMRVRIARPSYCGIRVQGSKGGQLTYS
jgi:hypothetical protein